MADHAMYRAKFAGRNRTHHAALTDSSSIPDANLATVDPLSAPLES